MFGNVNERTSYDIERNPIKIQFYAIFVNRTNTIRISLKMRSQDRDISRMVLMYYMRPKKKNVLAYIEST